MANCATRAGGCLAGTCNATGHCECHAGWTHYSELSPADPEDPSCAHSELLMHALLGSTAIFAACTLALLAKLIFWARKTGQASKALSGVAAPFFVAIFTFAICTWRLLDSTYRAMGNDLGFSILVANIGPLLTLSSIRLHLKHMKYLSKARLHSKKRKDLRLANWYSKLLPLVFLQALVCYQFLWVPALFSDPAEKMSAFRRGLLISTLANMEHLVATVVTLLPVVHDLTKLLRIESSLDMGLSGASQHSTRMRRIRTARKATIRIMLAISAALIYVIGFDLLALASPVAMNLYRYHVTVRILSANMCLTLPALATIQRRRIYSATSSQVDDRKRGGHTGSVAQSTDPGTTANATLNGRPPSLDSGRSS